MGCLCKPEILPSGYRLKHPIVRDGVTRVDVFNILNQPVQVGMPVEDARREYAVAVLPGMRKAG